MLHPGDPMLRIAVPAGAAYVGGARFTLYDVADCEIHVFVEADAQRRIRRLYWIQFESYLPSRLDARYDYGESDRRMDLWGAPAWARAFTMDTSRAPRAGSDTERVRTIVERAGYVAPPRLLAARLVRLLDDPQGTGYGRRELMLIYAEELTQAAAVPAEADPAVFDRAAAAFEVEAR